MIEGYAITCPVDVRWRDVDALGHVNNAVYFTYLEMGRTRYLDHVFGSRRLEEIQIMVVSAHCDYLSQVTHGDHLEVGIRIPRAGNTSFDFEYEIRSLRDGRLVARGLTTQVLYDHREGKKLAVTDAWLDRVEAAQGIRPVRKPAAEGPSR